MYRGSRYKVTIGKLISYKDLYIGDKVGIYISLRG
jgi:hypothetical protein